MFHALVTLLRRTLLALFASDSTHQLAAGFTLGMLIGVVPKSNLIALSLCVLLFSLRVNRGLALVAAVVFSCVAGWTDPFCHKLGLTVLTVEPLQATYASVLKLPLGPWLGFNNTAVTGTLLLGLYAAFPVYYLSRITCSWIEPLLANRFRFASQWGMPQTGTTPGGAP
jgi:uncharacterized protein (TIGR03546 family)